jgi:hypothetical protein
MPVRDIFYNNNKISIAHNITVLCALHFEIKYTAISIKAVHEQSGKAEHEHERLLGIANKLINFQSNSQQPPAPPVDNLN